MKNKDLGSFVTFDDPLTDAVGEESMGNNTRLGFLFPASI